MYAIGQAGLRACRNLRLPDNLSGGFVVSAKHGLAAPSFAGKQQRPGHQNPGARRTAGSRDVQALEGGTVPDGGRRVAIRDLPGDLALVHVVGRDAAIRRLHQGQAVDPGQTETVAAHIAGGLRIRLRPRQGNDRRTGVGADINESGFRVRRARFPVGAASKAGKDDRPAGSAGRLAEGTRCVDWAGPERFDGLDRFRPQLRREIDQVVRRDSLDVERRRPGRKRLRRERQLSGNIRRRDRPFLDRPDRCAGDAIEHVGKGLFRELNDRLDWPAANVDIHEDRVRGHVVIPDIVVNELPVPDDLSCFDVDAHQRIRKQVGARTIASVHVVGGRLNREIDITQCRVDGVRPPHPGVPRVFGGVVQPRFVAGLSLSRNRMNDPFLLPVRTSKAMMSAFTFSLLIRAPTSRAGPRRSCCAQSRPATCFRFARSDPRYLDSLEEVHNPVLAETLNRDAGPRVQRDDAESGSDDDDAFVLTVRPGTPRRGRNSFAAPADGAPSRPFARPRASRRSRHRRRRPPGGRRP